MTSEKTSNLLVLAERISEAARTLHESVSPPPTFQNDTLVGIPDHLQVVRNDLIDATDTLNGLVRGAGGEGGRIFRNAFQGFANELSMQAIYYFRIAQVVPLDKPVSYGEISRQCEVDEAALTRLIRHAMTIRLFREPEPGMVEHTVDSRLLVEDQDLFDFLGAIFTDIHSAYNGVLDALKKWPGSEEPNHAGYQIAFRTNETMYEQTRRDPERTRRFGGLMKFVSRDVNAGAMVATGYPWDTVGEAQVVDVGGGKGHISIAIASEHASLTFIVQDFPGVYDEGMQSLPAQLESRVSFMAHNFFDEQPVKGADIYIYSQIIHNWSDGYAVKIFRQLIPALKPGAKIMIVDKTIPAPDTASNYELNHIRSLDLNMMALMNARERSVTELEELLRRTDSRFRLSDVYQLGIGMWSIVEVVWAT